MVFNGDYKPYWDKINLINVHLCENKKHSYDSWNTLFMSEPFDKLPREIQEENIQEALIATGLQDGVIRPKNDKNSTKNWHYGPSCSQTFVNKQVTNNVDTKNDEIKSRPKTY